MKLSHLLIATLLSSGIASAQTGSKVKKPSFAPTFIKISTGKKASDGKTEKKQKQKQLCVETIYSDEIITFNHQFFNTWRLGFKRAAK